MRFAQTGAGRRDAVTVELYFSRARLNDNLGRLGPILFPDAPAQRMGVSHRLVWSLFPDGLRERPFLYRDTAPSTATGRAARGEFLILSTIRPEQPKELPALFTLETKAFEPALKAGDRLHFSLRANPTMQRNDKSALAAGGTRKTRRFDVVMHALHGLPVGADRARERPRVIRDAGLRWLTRQGEAAGFVLPDPRNIAVDGYEQFAIDPENPRNGRQPGHSRIDFAGELEVNDPDLFLSRLAAGFGRARAFGHGLMLIRRA
jgi:CRISPR system Cascade subunit CasE